MIAIWLVTYWVGSSLIRYFSPDAITWKILTNLSWSRWSKISVRLQENFFEPTSKIASLCAHLYGFYLNYFFFFLNVLRWFKYFPLFEQLFWPFFNWQETKGEGYVFLMVLGDTPDFHVLFYGIYEWNITKEVQIQTQIIHLLK